MRSAAAPAALATAVLFAAGCGGSSSSGTELTGKRAQLNAGSAVVSKGIKMSAVAPATGGAVSVYMPITGGKMDFSSGKGQAELGGGLRYQAGSHSATLTNVVIDTDKNQLTAKVGGDQTTVMDVSPSSVQSSSSALAQAIKLTLTSDGAKKLGDALGVSLQSGATMANGVLQATSG